VTVASSLRSSSTAPDPVEWRELKRDLWAARRDGHPLGTVEHGRGYLASGSDAQPLGRYRTLEAAMDAVAHPEGHPVDDRPQRRSWNGLVFVGTLSVAAGMLLAVYALLGL
jgi:hypothetical protein